VTALIPNPTGLPIRDMMPHIRSRSSQSHNFMTVYFISLSTIISSPFQNGLFDQTHLQSKLPLRPSKAHLHYPKKPLEESEVCRCNCSICTKSGYILVYPKREDVAFTAGEATLSEYRFGKKNKPHKFCPNCGTSMFIDFKDALDEWNAGRGAEEKQRQFIALNV